MTTTYMNLTEPTPGVGGTPGPLWAQEVNSDLSLIDSHDHTSGHGAPIVAASLNINGDLPFNSNNATALRSTRYTNYASIGAFNVNAAVDKSCILSIGGELFWIDQAGNQVQLTQGGHIKSAPGNIGNLAAGVAPNSAVTYGDIANNLVFYQDNLTGALMNLVADSLILPVPGSGGLTAHNILIQAPASMPTSYDITLPAAPPATEQVLGMDSSGNLTLGTAQGLGMLPIGSVIAHFPNTSYTCSASRTADSKGFILCDAGGTVSDVTSPINGAAIPYLNNDIFLKGSTTAGSTGGSTSTDSQLGTIALSVTGSGTTTVSGSVTMPTHAHTLNGDGAAAWAQTSGGQIQFNLTAVPFSLVDVINGIPSPTSASGTSSFGLRLVGATSDVISPPTIGFTSTGTNGFTSTGTTASQAHTHNITPVFISTVYIMRIK